MNQNIVMKIYQYMVKIKPRRSFFISLSLLVVVTMFVFFVDRLIFIHLHEDIGYYPNQNPLILVIVSLFFLFIVCIALLYQSIKINKKRYFYFQKMDCYVSLAEFSYTFIWNLQTIVLTYFFLYHHFYPDQFTPFSEQIYQDLFWIFGILWGVFSIGSYLFIREFVFCVCCMDVLNDPAAYDQLRELLDRFKKNEIVLKTSEISLEIEGCIEKGLIQIRRKQSLSEIREKDKVCFYFESPFLKMIQDRKQIVEKGLFMENYF